LVDFFPFSIFSKLHEEVFNDNLSPLEKRLLAYWIMTYGIMRLVAGLYTNMITIILSAMTYIIELFFGYTNITFFIQWMKKK